VHASGVIMNREPFWDTGPFSITRKGQFPRRIPQYWEIESLGCDLGMGSVFFCGG